MFLYRLYLNMRCREVRRDLASPYELHSTLCRAFSSGKEKCSASSFLWRLEKDINHGAYPQVLVQSSLQPDWSRVGVDGWFANAPEDPLDLFDRLSLANLSLGQRFRFRLQANPCVSRRGKRQGLMNIEDQEKWIVRMGQIHGFELPTVAPFTMDEAERVDVMISQGKMLYGRQRVGNNISIYSVQYDGLLMVTDVEKILSAVKTGIGHGKTMGLGLLSLALKA
jgi:CRISPR system Cascade subunit CasE